LMNWTQGCNMNVRVASLLRSQRRLVRLVDNDLHLIFADSLGSI
jgi:hypothetical protein